MHVCRFEQVADHHLGPGGPQGRRPLVVAVDHGADGEPPIEEEVRHESAEKIEGTMRVFALRPTTRLPGASTSPLPFRNVEQRRSGRTCRAARRYEYQLRRRTFSLRASSALPARAFSVAR